LWGSPYWGWGAPYPYYSDWPPYYNTYPNYNYPAPYGPSNSDPNSNNIGDSSLYGPAANNGYTGTDVNTNLASGTPVTDPITANVVEFAPSVLVYLKDGTTLAADDYWMTDGQFHYRVKYGGESSVGMDEVDMQRTVDENAKRGVRFTLKSKPATNPDGTVSNRTVAPSTAAPVFHRAASAVAVSA